LHPSLGFGLLVKVHDGAGQPDNALATLELGSPTILALKQAAAGIEDAPQTA
jgi:hypothetical protein